MRKFPIILILILILISCKKDPQNSNVTTTENCRLEELRNKMGKKVCSYEYFSDNKIKKILDFDTTTANLRSYVLFDYAANKVVKNSFDVNDLLLYSESFSLNNLGWASYKTSSQTNYSDTSYFEYDSLGYLIKSIEKVAFNSFDTLYYSYNEGKRVLITSKAKPHTIDSIKYEYYDFKIPRNIKTLLYNKYELFGDPIDNEMFLGINTDFALKSRTVRFTDDGNYILDYEYSYEFDAADKLTKIKGTIGYKNMYLLHSFEMNYQINCQ
jgi:hypothetical protein